MQFKVKEMKTKKMYRLSFIFNFFFFFEEKNVKVCINIFDFLMSSHGFLLVTLSTKQVYCYSVTISSVQIE